MEELWPVLCGADPVGPEAAMAKANGRLIGHEYAKSALDIAPWDIMGKVANMPLYTLLGGRRQADMPLCHSITCIAPEEMVKIARDAQAIGTPNSKSNWAPTTIGRPMSPARYGTQRWDQAHWYMAIGTVGQYWMQSVLAARSKIWTSCWNNPATMEDCKRVIGTVKRTSR